MEINYNQRSASQRYSPKRELIIYIKSTETYITDNYR